MKKIKNWFNKLKWEDEFHDEDNKVTIPLSKNLDENIKNLEILFKDCGDFVKRKFPIGINKELNMFIGYIDLMIDRRVIEESLLEQLILQVRSVSPSMDKIKSSIYEFIRDGGIATADVKEVETLDEAVLAVLSGDTILLIDGYAKVIVIGTKGWPNRGIQNPDSEVVVRGPKEAFSEALRMNTVLIRRRIRDTKLKVKQLRIGNRSRTDIALMYIEDIVRKDILEEVEKRLNNFKIDGILDSGNIEQLIEDNWKSPFPQIQGTQRPDKASSAILEGRIAIIVDNSPFVLLIPTTINSFFKSSEDYYQRWSIMSFTRFIRYIAAIFSAAIPGFYIALTDYHPSMIPTPLTMAIAASREAVPFPSVVEVVLMELAFELLREAGIRLPGPIGNTIGIVGGIIIGQAAVEAKIVSPIVVIIVSVTAISSFAIPDDSLTVGFRLIKYLIIAFSAVLGLYGFLLGGLVVLIHLVSLKSFGIPYMFPYVSSVINNYYDLKDSIFRLPIFMINKRPIFARPNEKIRLKIKNKKGE
ncbi:spore germination protein [Defluviitalea phaphyphila]|uniref:spore germination protein n=1 Tax=Defluviitalea phaphyphila TaxID=1473580 RepID=UPI00073008AB|nr:spore germination protein [Defluviitalea phaphyphila]